jgi:hypothetical protein
VAGVGHATVGAIEALQAPGGVAIVLIPASDAGPVQVGDVHRPEPDLLRGFSFGGMMSNAVGCAGLARAIGPMAGNSTVSGRVAGTQPVAYMGFHGTHDSVVDISGGRTARDIFVKRNGCSSTTVPSSPSWCDGIASTDQPCTCVDYQGCMPGYPVTWCEYNADHQAASNSDPTLWSVFTQF